MPIHDQSYRRYGGGKATPGQAWLVIASAGIRTMLRKRAFLGVLLFAWGPFIVRAVQIYVTTNYPQVAAAFAVTAQTFRDFLEQQDFFVFIVTIYVGAGLIANDRRANALQIYLSKPLMRTEYIAGKAAVLFSFLLLVTLGAGDAAAVPAGRAPGQLRVPANEPVPVPGDHRRGVPAGAARDVHDARALVAVEEQPLRRHPLRRHHLLHRRGLRRDVRDHRQTRRCRGCRSARA